MKNVHISRMIAVGLVVSFSTQGPLCAMGVRETVSSYAHVAGDSVSRRAAQVKESVSHVASQAQGAVKNRLGQAHEGAKETLSRTWPRVAVGTAALGAAGAAGYCASEIVRDGTRNKIIAGATGVALGAGSLWALGPARTAALVVAASAGWAVRNRVALSNISRSYSADEDMLVVQGTRFDLWEIHRWPTGIELSADEKAVITQLRTDISSANESFKIAAHQGSSVTWLDVLNRIKEDLELVKRGRLALEDKYLAYVPHISLLSDFGIKSRYAALCKRLGVIEVTPGVFQDIQYWTPEQVNSLRDRLFTELYVPGPLVGKVLQRVLKPNFAKAAQQWWSLKNAQGRLDALASFVKKLGANTVSEPLAPYCETCGRWAEHGARGCTHASIGVPAGFNQDYAPRGSGGRLTVTHVAR